MIIFSTKSYSMLISLYKMICNFKSHILIRKNSNYNLPKEILVLSKESAFCTAVCRTVVRFHYFVSKNLRSYSSVSIIICRGEPVYTVQRDSMYTSYISSVDRAIWTKFWLWVEHYNTHVSV